MRTEHGVTPFPRGTGAALKRCQARARKVPRAGDVGTVTPRPLALASLLAEK